MYVTIPLSFVTNPFIMHRVDISLGFSLMLCKLNYGPCDVLFDHLKGQVETSVKLFESISAKVSLEDVYNLLNSMTVSP